MGNDTSEQTDLYKEQKQDRARFQSTCAVRVELC